MCPSTYLSHSYTQCLPYVSVSLSPSHLPLFYVIMSVYHVYSCVRLSVTLMSYTCFHINRSYQLTELCRHACQSACSSTWLSIRSFSVYSSAYFCFTVVFHLFYILSSFQHKVGLRCCRFARTVTTSTSADLT